MGIEDQTLVGTHVCVESTSVTKLAQFYCLLCFLRHQKEKQK